MVPSPPLEAVKVPLPQKVPLPLTVTSAGNALIVTAPDTLLVAAGVQVHEMIQ